MTTLGTRAGWLVMAALAILVALASFRYFSFNLQRVAPPGLGEVFVNEQPFVYTHIFASTIALAIGPFQFAGAIRRRRTAIHRNLGRLYLLACLAGGIAALRMSIDSTGGWVSHVGFGMLAVAWLVTGGMAYRRIRHGEVDAHQEWMIRSYALTFAAVTLRIWLPVLVATIGFNEGYPLVSWLCWVPNMIVGEAIVHGVQERRLSRRTHPAHQESVAIGA